MQLYVCSSIYACINDQTQSFRKYYKKKKEIKKRRRKSKYVINPIFSI